MTFYEIGIVAGFLVGAIHNVPIEADELQQIDRVAGACFAGTDHIVEQHDRTVHHDALPPARYAGEERADPFRRLGFDFRGDADGD